MNRTLIIHAGMPRAGSSTLQEGLSGNRRKLEAAGLLYPKLFAEADGKGSAHPDYNHRELCLAGKGLWPGRRFTRLLDDIAAQIEASPAAVAALSYEGWWDPRNRISLQRSVKALRRRLPGLRVVIAGIVRDPASFLLSLYRLDVLHGRTIADFEAYWPRRLREPRLRYGTIGASFAKLADETRFIRFEACVQDGRLIGNAFDAFGLSGLIERAGLLQLERYRSPGSIYFNDAIISMMRFATVELGAAPTPQARRDRMQRLRDLSQQPEHRAASDALVIPMSSTAANAITAATRDQALAFYRRYLDKVPMPPAGEDGKPQSTIRRESALGSAILAALASP